MVQCKSVREIAWAGQRALVRVDFNVPQDAAGRITDETRLQAALPTLQFLLSEGASLTILSHLGRPRPDDQARLTLRPVAERLGQLLAQAVHLVTDLDIAQAPVHPMDQAVVMLENTRFHAGETQNDPELAQWFSQWGDVYVNDAFGSMHRAHASTVGVTRFLPAVAGLLVAREIQFLSPLASAPERPVVILMGGAKISDKIAVIHNLLDLADVFLLGGGMANTFLSAQGYNMEASLVERDVLHRACDILEAGREKIHLPSDVQVGAAPEAETAHQTVGVDEIPSDWLALDIGEATIAHYANRLAGAATVFWNGPMGLSEVSPFDKGTKLMAQCLSELKGATTIVGGGDSAAAVHRAGLVHTFSHVSTGGGAALAFVGGRDLPGLQALNSICNRS